MTQQVLALKWRPRTFNEVIGQPHVVKALSNGLDNNRLHHAFLFTGTRGVGKTTLARIFAKSLNCEQGVSSHPCGECSICKEVDSGRFVDLIEIDAASRTRVEDTREILDNVQYAPTRGRYKIYLIDEVHMLSNSSFNALLKTLEEPPAHVKFLLATTDPQKLPVTVLSRCLRFQLKRISDQDITQQLAHILETEKIPFELEALKLISHAGDGSMRDSLSLLDQAIAYSGQNISYAQTHEMLGLIDTQHLEHLLEALASKDAQNVIETLKNIQSNGIDYPRFLEELIDAFHRLTMLQLAPDFANNESIAFQKLATLFTAEDLQLFYQVALNGRKDLQNHPNTAVGFEMTLLRMVLFAPTAPLSIESDNVVSPSLTEVTSSLVERDQHSIGKKNDVTPLEIEISSFEPEPVATNGMSPSIGGLDESELKNNAVVDNLDQSSTNENSSVSEILSEPRLTEELHVSQQLNTEVPWVVNEEISNVDESLEKFVVDSHITDDLHDRTVNVEDNELSGQDQHLSTALSIEETSIGSRYSEGNTLKNDVSSEKVEIAVQSEDSGSEKIDAHEQIKSNDDPFMFTEEEQGTESPLGSGFISSLTDLIENPDKVENHFLEIQADPDHRIEVLPDYLVDHDMPVSNNVHEHAIPQELPNTDHSTTKNASNTGLTSLTNNEEWLALVSSLSLESVLSGIAHSLVFKSYDGHQLVLERPLSVQDFRIDEAETRLAMAISAKLKTKVHCRIEYVEELSDESLHDRTERLDEERQEEAAQAFRNDEVVQYLESSFGAVLLEKTLKPREG